MRYTVNDSENGTFWYKEGTTIHHRENGPAIEYDNIKQWYYEGKRHRENGPAYEAHGVRTWWRHGKRHREDGPAVEYTSRPERVEWWYEGRNFINKEDWENYKNPRKKMTLVEIENILGQRIEIVESH